MIIELHQAPGQIQFDSTEGIDLSIPVSFTNPVVAYGAPAPSKFEYAHGSFVGSVVQGGSCNCDVIQINPHCHGTHTECVGHLTGKKMFVRDALEETIFLSKLVTIDCSQSVEITRHHIEKIGDLSGATALIIRTLPNEIGKKTMKYGAVAPYLSPLSIEYLNDKGIQHLLFDGPSIDPIEDGGKLLAHRKFWNVGAAEKEASIHSHLQKTITELVYVPGHVKDGFYVLELQISNLELDGVPSRPLIYPIRSWRPE
jgi:arylformamidase